MAWTEEDIHVLIKNFQMKSNEEMKQDLYSLLESYDNENLSNNSKELVELIHYFSYDEEGQELLVREFNRIIEMCDPKVVYYFASVLGKFEKGKEKVLDNYEMLLGRCGEHFIDNLSLIIADSKEGQEKLIRNYSNIYKRLLPDTVVFFTKAFSMFPEGRELILRDYDKLVRKCDKLDIGTFAVVFSSFKEGQDKIIVDYDKILKKCNKCSIAEFVEAFSRFEEGQKRIVEDYDALLKRNEPLNLPIFISGFANFKEGQDLMIKGYRELFYTVSPYRIGEFAKSFSTFKEGRELITEDYDSLFDKCKGFYRDFFGVFIESEEGREFLKKKDFLAYMMVTGDKKPLGVDDLYQVIKRNDMQESMQEFFKSFIKPENGEEIAKYRGLIGVRQVFQLNSGEDSLTVTLSTDRNYHEKEYSEEDTKPLLRDVIREKDGRIAMTMEVFKGLEFNDKVNNKKGIKADEGLKTENTVVTNPENIDHGEK